MEHFVEKLGFNQSSEGVKDKAPWHMYLLPYIVTFLFALSTKGGLWLFTVPCFAFVVIPILDAVYGIDTFNPEDTDTKKSLVVDNRYALITAVWAPVHAAIIFIALMWVDKQESILSIIGMIFAVGLIGGIVGINFAHELCHKTSKTEVALATAILVLVSYPHWLIEHTLGHHKHVATPNDPASSRLNESVYQFYPRTVIGTFLSAWNIEKERMAKAGCDVYSFDNRMIQYAFFSTFAYISVLFIFGLTGVIFFGFQGVVAFSSLEIINYVEHYGLSRKEIKPGVYENVRPKHSWNSGSAISNYLLINLARHSDHHTNSSKRYQLLRNEQELAPQCPYGYGTMFVMALFPSIWFRVMNPKVEAWNKYESKVK